MRPTSIVYRRAKPHELRRAFGMLLRSGYALPASQPKSASHPPTNPAGIHLSFVRSCSDNRSQLTAQLGVRLHSYVVRYDSGFAPNPFYGFCTLATCKPDIRKAAAIGDWIIGSGSADKKLKRGGFLVYAMRVTETPSFAQYWQDPRFQKKKPDLSRSRMRECGDNIYYKAADGIWGQLNSFHSKDDGSPHPRHVKRAPGNITRASASSMRSIRRPSSHMRSTAARSRLRMARHCA